LALRKIKKSVDHIKLTRGERNMDKRKTKEGKWVDRVTPEIPRKLELEMNWLEKYVSESSSSSSWIDSPFNILVSSRISH